MSSPGENPSSINVISPSSPLFWTFSKKPFVKQPDAWSELFVERDYNENRHFKLRRPSFNF